MSLNIQWKHVAAWVGTVAPPAIALWHLESPTTFDLVAKYVASAAIVVGPLVQAVLSSILSVDPGVRNASQGTTDKTAS